MDATHFATRRQATEEIAEYMLLYNRRRIHASLLRCAQEFMKALKGIAAIETIRIDHGKWGVNLQRRAHQRRRNTPWLHAPLRHSEAMGKMIQVVSP